jgi:phosphatidylserine/phosphatidylglycerophosphate/cardiolipin synthase-like enzyme
MIPRLLQRFKSSPSDLLTSQLYNEQTFYQAFVRDLNACTHEAVIESPFITSNRVASLLPIFKKMRSRNVRIFVNTRHPAEHEAPYAIQAAHAINQFQDIGVQVLFTGKLHRKIAVFDRRILWEGSLNILSQNDSCEVMRRVESVKLAWQMIQYIKLSWLGGVRNG